MAFKGITAFVLGNNGEGGGGGGGTSNYNELSNKPQINGNELSGNKTADQLGLLPADTDIPTKLSDLDEDTTHRTVTDSEKQSWNNKVDSEADKGLSTNDYSDTDKAIVDGVTTALGGKVDKEAGKGLSANDYTNGDKAKVDGLGTASTKNSTSVVTESSDLVESGAVYNAIQEFTKKVSNNEVYGLRQGKGNMVDLDLVGGSLAWNQIYRTSLTTDATNNGITATPLEDGRFNINGTATSTVVNIWFKGAYNTANVEFVIPANHKVLIADCHLYRTKNTSGEDYYGVGVGESIIISPNVNYSVCGVRHPSAVKNTTYNNVILNPQIIDLTQLFGSEIADYIYSLEQATEGAGVEWFKQYFPNDYYAYSAGAIQSVNVASRKVYDADNNLVSTYPFDSAKQLRGVPKLVDNKLNYDGDIYTADGQITRKYGIVDLGTLTWSYNSSTERFENPFEESVLINIKGSNSLYDIANILCPLYRACSPSEQTSSTAPNMTISIGVGIGNVIRIRNTSYTDPATFKTAMSGVYLVYELITPTIETAQPFQNPQRAYSDGIEEFIDAGVSAGTRDVAVPVGNDSVYYLSDALPAVEDYVDGTAKILEAEISTKADNSVIAPVENGTTASQAYAVDEQFYLNNVLMTATSQISQNDAIVVYPTSGYNCKPSDSITEQIADRVTYEDNGILGASNFFDSNVYTSVTLAVDVANMKYATGSANIGYAKVEPNRKYKISRKTAGTQFRIATSADIPDINVPIITTFANHTGTEIEVNVGETDVYIGIYTESVSALQDFKICLATDTNPTFPPYAETNYQLTQNKMSYKDNGVLGAKNLLPMSIEGIKKVSASGTFSGDTWERNGITIVMLTDDNDNIIGFQISGTATGVTDFAIAGRYNTLYAIIQSGSYKAVIEGAVSGVTFYAGYKTAALFVANSSTPIAVAEANNGISFAFLRIDSGTVISTPITVKTMICLASDSDNTYAVYSKTNIQLTRDKAENSVIGTVEGANASKAWSVGEHFIQDGQFKEVTQPIASGGAISDSNTADKPIADCLVKQATFSITTDASKGIGKIYSNTDRIILGIKANESGRVITPYYYYDGNDIGIWIKVIGSTGNAVTSTNITGTYYYID